jgi:hypothetical protein
MKELKGVNIFAKKLDCFIYFSIGILAGYACSGGGC